ncbi:MAG: DUF3108 domain-containing protein [Proteobacteria bacterium]|nr:DUF3108 domain-containing protein [Pseudomonadota bacterium]
MSLEFINTAQAAPPPTVRIVFEVTMGSLKIGRGIDTLQHDSGSYTLTSQIIPKGLASLYLDEIKRKSRGLVSAAGLTPKYFSEEGNKKKGRSEANFDWEKQEVTLVTQDGQQTLPLIAESADQATLPYLFAFKKKLPMKSSIYITDGRRFKLYQYERRDDDVIKTAIGALKVAHFKKVVDNDIDQQFEFWLSHQHDLLPIKIRFVDKKGNVIESTVQTLTTN